MGTQRDLERYAGLFSQRTRGMTSSAMRDLMAITERPDVISLAGGQPDTTSFPAELLAQLMSGVAAEASAKALQYSPTEGLWSVREAIVEVMAAEGTEVDASDVLVTTGGQQVIDLVCKTLIDPATSSSPRRRPTPARSRRSPPTRPTSCRSRWTPTG